MSGVKVRFAIPKYRCRLGHDHVAGDQCELPQHVAVKLVRLGYAEAVREAPVERAVKAPSETTAKRVHKTRTRKS